MGTIFYFKKLKMVLGISIIGLLLAYFTSLSDVYFLKYLKIIFLLPYIGYFIGGIGFYLLNKNNYLVKFHFLIISSLLINLLLSYNLHNDIIELIILILLYITMYLFVYGKLSFIIHKPLLFLGQISYPLYLIHENVGVGIIYWLKKVSNFQLFFLPITLIFVILISYLISTFIERPALRFIRNKMLK